MTIDRKREELYRTYIYWTPRHDLAFSGEYQFERFQRPAPDPNAQAQDTESPLNVTTHMLPFALRYFHPTGMFSEIKITYVDQDVDTLPGSGPTASGEEFVTLDVALGYRLPKRFGIISLEGRNVTGEEFRFQDVNFQNTDARGPRFIPDASVLLRATFSF
jgi:hypothetical protein